jgi:tRNA modification GTPase
VVAHFDAASSYTGEALYEVNCHGGAIAVQAVLRRLQEAGAEMTPWQSLAPRLGAGEPTLSPQAIRCEALARMPRAHTRLAARMLLHQARGALSEELKAIHADLSRGSTDPTSLTGLIKTAALGHALLHPPTVMLAGLPNVGKSTLLNALLRRERVIVHEQPGTTRDILRETVSIRGVPFELMDCAGLRADAEGIEHEAVRRAAELLNHCDVLLLVYDVRTGLDGALASVPPLPRQARVIFVGNKTDLLDGPQPAPRTPGGPPHVFISARQQCNIADLEAALLAPYEAAVSSCETGAPVVFTDQVRAALERALETLRESGPERAAAELSTQGVS